MNFDNKSYWNNRYRSNPELGSGMGSKGPVAAYKKGILNSLVKMQNPTTVLDIACGDMTVSSELPEKGYTGVDISKIILEKNKKNFPNRKFLYGNINDLNVENSDLVVCFDLLIHIKDFNEYYNTVLKCVELTKTAGVVSGFEYPPKIPSKITFYHEPISKTLYSVGAKNIHKIGSYRQVDIFHFNKIKPFKNSEKNSKLKLIKPIFLIGSMRSGTTILANLLGQSQEIAHCPFELKDIWSSETGVPMASAKTKDRECPECREDCVLAWQNERLSRAFLKRIGLLHNKVKPYAFLNKNPHLCNKLPWVSKLFPDARFIWLHRNLPQVVASLKILFIDVCKRQSTWHWWPFHSDKIKNRCWNTFFSSEESYSIPIERVFPGGNIKFLAEYWLETNRAVADFFNNSKEHFKIEICFESFLEDPSCELSWLQGMLNVSHSAVQSDIGIIKKDRNQNWIKLLDKNERYELSKFVTENATEIEHIFPGEKRAETYIEMLK